MSLGTSYVNASVDAKSLGWQERIVQIVVCNVSSIALTKQGISLPGLCLFTSLHTVLYGTVCYLILEISVSMVTL